MDYVDQLRAEMIRALPTQSKREKEAFSKLQVQEQAWRFMNWQSRLIHPHPRQLNKSVGFDNQPGVQKNKLQVAALLVNIELGRNVSSHLSEDIEQGYCLHEHGRKHGPDFDLLLNEWGIHHLHLGQSTGNDKTAGRTDELLYAIFGRGVVFALAVMPHRAWTNRKLIEVTVHSWPHQGLFVAIKGLMGKGWPESEHGGLRKVGLTTAAPVSNQFWISGVTCGITTALVSNRISREASKLLRLVFQANEHPEHVATLLKQNADLNGVAWPANPKIHLSWRSGPDRYCFVFTEEGSGATVLIDTSLSNVPD